MYNKYTKAHFIKFIQLKCVYCINAIEKFYLDSLKLEVNFHRENSKH